MSDIVLEKKKSLLKNELQWDLHDKFLSWSTLLQLEVTFKLIFQG